MVIGCPPGIASYRSANRDRRTILALEAVKAKAPPCTTATLGLYGG